MGRGIFIDWSFWKDKDTTLSEKALFLEIQNLSILKLGCIASNSHFADLMGIKKEAVSRLLSSLEKKGYILSEIKPGSRNHSRVITINKLLFEGKQNVIPLLTNCLESKDNITINKTINIVEPDFKNTKASFERFVEDIRKDAPIKSKVVSNEKCFVAYKILPLEDKKIFKLLYIAYQKEKGEFSPRIPDFMVDFKFYKSNYKPTPKKRRGGQIIV